MPRKPRARAPSGASAAAVLVGIDAPLSVNTTFAGTRDAGEGSDAPPTPPPTHMAAAPHAPSPSPSLPLSCAPKRPLTRTTKKAITLDDVERAVAERHKHAVDLSPAARKKIIQAEYKRLKHCETVRQSRVRKKAERSGLRHVNDELEAQLNQCLATLKAQPRWRVVDETSWWSCTLRKFVLSIDEVRALRSENSNLKDRLMFFDTLGEQIERLQEDFEIPDYLHSVRTCGMIHFEPLTSEEAAQIMVESHQEAMNFFDRMRRLPVDETKKTMGWSQHQNVTADGRVQFNFTKRLLTVGVEELVERSWRMYCDIQLYRGIYACVQRLEILQRINENTLLIRRDLQETNSSPMFRCIFLLFRIKLENGYLICFRSHNPAVYADDNDDPNVQWMEMFYWLMVTEPPAGSGVPVRACCDVSFGGNLLNDRSARHATLWKYQIAMALLRWESNAVAPLFQLLG